jgi:hypothetical protein
MPYDIEMDEIQHRRPASSAVERRCERCGRGNAAEIEGEVWLCTGPSGCLRQLLLEWRIRHDEFGELSA